MKKDIRIVAPQELLSTKRFDIMFKYMYAYLLEKGIDESWSRDLYSHHLEVWNNFYEKEPHKQGLEDFISSFKSLLASIKAGGYDKSMEPVPVDISTGAPLNGAHRVAASLLFNKEVMCEYLDFNSNPNVGCFCDSSYLIARNTYVEGGLKSDYADLAAHQYTKLNSNVRIVCLFPSAVGVENENKVVELLNRRCNVLYSKTVNLTPLGAFNFIRFAYDEDASRGNPWLGTAKNGWPGARSKANHCFKGSGNIRLVWFEEKSPEDSVKLKQEIRDIYKIGKHSVHINDTHTETLAMSGYLLNQNGIEFLNFANPVSTEVFDTHFSKYREWLESTGYDKEDFCVDSSAVLSAFGLRDCRDLDFLYHGNFINTGMEDVSCHNEEMKYYQDKKSDIIFNPENHFYYKGLKFASLDVIRRMKVFRNEEKDKKDVSLIDICLSVARGKKV